MNKAQTYVVVGFLGSGKTTFLNNIFDFLKGRKVAVVVNEFGEKSTDGPLLQTKFENVSEIAGGSVFCTCRMDQFVDLILELAKGDFDYIFVEGSGLANPAGIYKVLDLIKKKSEDKIDFKGVIGIVDATTIHKTIDTLNAIQNQLVFSDIVLLNKTDLATSDQIENARKIIRKYNTNARIYETVYAKISLEDILVMSVIANKEKGSGNIDLNLQQATFALPDITRENLEKLCQNCEKDIDRIKGMINLNDNCYFFEYVNQELKLIQVDGEHSNHIVFLSSTTKNIQDLVRKEIEALKR